MERNVIVLSNWKKNSRYMIQNLFVSDISILMKYVDQIT